MRASLLLLLVSSVAFSKEPTKKVSVLEAAKVERDLAQVKLLIKQANEAVQRITEITQSAIQPLTDELNEIGQSSFTADEIMNDTVHVNAKTGEITRKGDTQASAPSKKESAK